MLLSVREKGVASYERYFGRFMLSSRSDWLIEPFIYFRPPWLQLISARLLADSSLLLLDRSSAALSVGGPSRRWRRWLGRRQPVKDAAWLCDSARTTPGSCCCSSSCSSTFLLAPRSFHCSNGTTRKYRFCADDDGEDDDDKMWTGQRDRAAKDLPLSSPAVSRLQPVGQQVRPEPAAAAA